MTTVIMVRHGQSEANLARRFAGHTNVSLTDLGQKQAEQAAEFLRDYPIDVIYASDLQRAMKTAEPTAAIHGLEIIANRELREIDAGNWEMVSYDTLLSERYDEYILWRTDIGHAHPSGGESVLALSERVTDELDRLLERHRGECIAIFSHYTPIRAMLCRIAGLPFEKMQEQTPVENGSVSVATLDDEGGWRIRVLGYVGEAQNGEILA